PWISEEAIRRTIQAAPRMFRYVYVAENLEIFYSLQSRRFIDWCERMLTLCVRHHLKMLFKEKHDCWGLVVADPEIGARLFKPEFRETIVPIFSTNQPYQPEVQWGGLIGLKQVGWVKEFGMSTQYWNWHEWMVRDVDVASACPSDVMLRLELLGASLGATWFHIEGGQPHLQADPERGFVPTGTRRFELVHALLRKNLLVADAPLANRNRVVLVRSMHPELERAKAEDRRIFYPYYARNVNALRKGLMAATWMFEPYAPLAFPRLAYGATHNGTDCFPETPLGWFDIVPRGTALPAGRQVLETDGERVRWKGQWTPVEGLAKDLPALLRAGAEELPLEAPGATLVLQGPLDTAAKEYCAILIDPGYLAPTGVRTALQARGGRRFLAEDLVTGEALTAIGGDYAVTIAPGAFRILKVTLAR
ncbi:MAG: hypothetical protein M1541_03705, partial [Acidobacteria bacterium]|nr:hypothetical protein [Acidobacteriota bacterium]